MRISDWSSDVCSSDLALLAGIHDVFGIERLLDLAHHRQCFAVLGRQEAHLAGADAVLAGAGATHGEGAHHHALVNPLGACHLLGVVGIDEESEMEVRSEEHTSELQSLMRISYAVFCLTNTPTNNIYTQNLYPE